ncbi:hypothetical protein SCHPADRAFT_997896 [Schizopora paradoxa]|uniref:Uncharacterized protein n=1 Tax=Schizopora paradoxa TaxID=27342 RepID=A0A0H2RLL2_9AGAM|nr:hypothetical protein SCHPADRAFT_997896 [Schizopora paradoxa]
MNLIERISSTFRPRFTLRSLKTLLVVCTLIYVRRSERKRLTRRRDEVSDELPQSRLQRPSTRSSRTRITGNTNAKIRSSEGDDEETREKSARHERKPGHGHEQRRQKTTSDAELENAIKPPRLEVVVHEQPNRTERLFLDRINVCDEEELLTACNQLNSEITTCTQTIADEWLQARPDVLEQSNVSPSMISSTVREAIGSEIMHRIQDAKFPHSHLDLESTLEFALRAWTIDCVARFISSTLLSSSSSDLERIANKLAASDRPSADAWYALLQEAWQTSGCYNENSRAVLDETFRQLVKIYGARGQLSMALRWRALAYQVVNKHRRKRTDTMRSLLLEGLRQILQYACGSSNLTPPTPGYFPSDDHIASLFDPINHLAEILLTGFMTSIYEVSAVRPGKPYESHRMEAWDPEEARRGTAQPVVCTIELGISRVSVTEAQPPDGRFHIGKRVFLLKPVVLV